jgi:putative SOS response-associated peptidase YedK
MCFSVEIERDLKKLSLIFGATLDQEAFHTLHHFSQTNPKMFKVPGKDNRIFPNIFSPVLISKEGTRSIRPMRYRVRPAGSTSEVPSKYNLYNARLDGLQKRKTWKTLMGRQHCLFPFKKFFEWVKGGPSGKKRLVTFFPQGKDIMWVPGLYDKWVSEDKTLSFESFALITDDPPHEILEQGHDRAPLFLKEEKIDEWLNFPSQRGQQSVQRILSYREEVIYGHRYD